MGTQTFSCRIGGMASYIQRAVEPEAVEIMTVSPVLLIEGARQVGKSTMAQKLLQGRDVVSVTLDDAATLEALKADPQSFVDQAGDGVLLIDEIQRFPEVTLAVKASVDKNRQPGRFILTGSSDFSRIRGDKDSLAGRAMSIRLRPFSQAELCGSIERGAFVDRIFSAINNPISAVDTSYAVERNDLISLLLRGGYPPLMSMTSRLRQRWITDYLERLLRVDVNEGGGRLNPQRLHTLLRLIVAAQGGEVVKARLGQEASIPSSSITGYLDALNRLFLIEEIVPWSSNATSREIGRKKTWINDASLAAHLIGADEAFLSDPIKGGKTLGVLTEGLVAQELRAQMEWSQIRYHLAHFRDRQGHEVDFVIDVPGQGLLAIEVKASSTIRREHFRGIEYFSRQLGSEMRAGIVLAPISRPQSFGEGKWALPLSALWA